MTPRTLALFAAVAVPLVGAVVVLGVITEDVTQHNGLATMDPSHLRVFIEHRSVVLVNAAKMVSDLGATPVLATLALLAAGLLWWRGQRVVVAVAPGIAFAAAAVVASVAKQVVGRGRPPVGLR